jgi:hypothetical protein
MGTRASEQIGAVRVAVAVDIAARVSQARRSLIEHKLIRRGEDLAHSLAALRVTHRD